MALPGGPSKLSLGQAVVERAVGGFLPPGKGQGRDGIGELEGREGSSYLMSFGQTDNLHI